MLELIIETSFQYLYFFSFVLPATDFMKPNINELKIVPNHHLVILIC